MKKSLIVTFLLSLTLCVFARETEIRIANERDSTIILAGTLSEPEGSLKAVLVLGSGSGQQDRDETLWEHKPFKALAERLVSSGIAVFRFDDRGTGESTGEYNDDVTTLDFAEDLRSVFRHIRNLPEFEEAKCGIFGHSEAGFEALMIANDSVDRPDFIITYGGPAMNGTRMMLNQVKAMMEGTPAEGQWALMRPILSRRYELVTSYLGKEELKSALWRDIKLYTPEEMLTPEVTAQIQAEIDMMASEWYRNMLRLDPTKDIRNLQIPWLAIYGSTDRQVPAEPNVSILNELGNHRITIKVIDNVNHLMQPSTSGFPSEYPTNPDTLSEQIPEIIVDWVSAF